jgi:hypothetical protein
MGAKSTVRRWLSSIVARIRGDKTIIRSGRAGRVSFAMTDDDWVILALLTEPTPLSQLPMRVVQRCLHLYKAGYLYTDPKGWVVVSLHGRRELGRRNSIK